MELEKLSDENLMERTKALVGVERRVSVKLIRHFGEIERRRLYARVGYSSMWDLLTRYYGYSESAATRRVAASRLLEDVPAVEEKLRSGDLSLCVAARVQQFCQREKLSPEEILEKVDGKSLAQAEKVFATLAPNALPLEKSKPLTKDHFELKIVVEVGLKNTIDQLRVRLRVATYADLFQILAEDEWKRLEKSSMKSTTASNVKNTGEVSASIRRHIWERDQSQ